MASPSFNPKSPVDWFTLFVMVLFAALILLGFIKFAMWVL